MSISNDGRALYSGRNVPIIEEKKTASEGDVVRQLCAQYAQTIPTREEMRNAKRPDIESVERDLRDDPMLGALGSQKYVTTLLKEHGAYSDILADYLIARRKSGGQTDIGPYLGYLLRRTIGSLPLMSKPADCP